jgi:hypothetical protein
LESTFCTSTMCALSVKLCSPMYSRSRCFTSLGVHHGLVSAVDFVARFSSVSIAIFS